CSPSSPRTTTDAAHAIDMPELPHPTTTLDNCSYTTLVGASESGYDQERPTYKRRPARVPTAHRRAVRAEECDKLIARMAGLATADPPLLLSSHMVSRRLLDEPSPQLAADFTDRQLCCP
ncbi:hypothetical protein ABZS86_35030, partial [Streptomyces sp. NPDC005355]